MAIFDSQSWCGQPKDVLDKFIDQLSSQGNRILWRGEVEDEFKQFLKTFSVHEKKIVKSALGQKITRVHKILVMDDGLVIMLRPIVGIREAVHVSRKDDYIESIDNDKYLALCETLATGSPSMEAFSFSIDFAPFRIFNPDKPDPTLIGKGLERLSHIFVSKIHENPHWVLSEFLSYLSHRKVEGMPIFFNKKFDLVSIHTALEKALKLAKLYTKEECLDTLFSELSLIGFARGWGNNSTRIHDSLSLLDKILHNPDESAFNMLLRRLPLVENVVLVSIHGWFAQEGVLGRPDTGGQIVYILNQARALEKLLRNNWLKSGIDIMPKIIILSRLIPEADGTTVNEPKEKIKGTENSYIFRVPFRDEKGEVVPQWMSRFKVWPYLNRFTSESYNELMLEFGGSPDLILGNYSDGNLVATALGRVWGSVTGIIAHALEKNKYRLSELLWKELEEDYHFSAHYLNDMLSTNSADFVITSTYQEIAGTETETGQYESYCVFTLPQNYRVRSGIDIYTPQFVINPPGYNPDTCFPYTDKSRRDEQLTKQVEELCFGKEQVDGSVGYLDDPSKTPIFAMSRLDKIKNVSGLVKIFAQSKELREHANLIVVGGVTSVEKSNDIEEKQQIKLIHRLIEKYKLQGSVRWLKGETDVVRVSEFYRVMADHKGVFVQPALYEAFGLTVIESMACGLPVIATKYGGPSESIDDGTNGLLFDPQKGKQLVRAVLRLISTDGDSTKFWDRISNESITHAEEKFSWDLHVGRLVEASGLYGFWNQLFRRDKEVTLNYVDALYYLLLLPRMKDEISV